MTTIQDLNNLIDLYIGRGIWEYRLTRNDDDESWVGSLHTGRGEVPPVIVKQLVEMIPGVVDEMSRGLPDKEKEDIWQEGYDQGHADGMDDGLEEGRVWRERSE